MRARLLLIRHCHSRVDSDTAPSTWGLTEDGQSQARALVGALASDGFVVVSCGDEPKMVETVEPLAAAVGLPVEARAAFGESHSQGWFGLEDFNAIVSAFFADPLNAPAPGWEPARTAAQRFLTGLGEFAGRHATGTVAVCSGGRVLTAVLCELGLVESRAAFDTWRDIRMPDVAVVEFREPDEPLILRHFGQHDEALD